MRSEGIPPDCKKVLLTLFYQDGFCTCQAIWDAVEIKRQLEDVMCVTAATMDGVTYYVKRTRNSQPIGLMLTKTIVERWAKGEYVKVRVGVADGQTDLAWMS